MKKRLVCILLASMMVMMCSCGASNDIQQKEETSSVVEVNKEEDKVTDEVIEAVDEEVLEEVVEEVEDTRSEAQKFVAQMNVGWNLGNTLDAHGAGNSLSTETCWGNPKTTKGMIDAIKAQGFNMLRVPVTFAEHLGPAPDYTINEDFLDRVEEIVNYGLDNDMFVIMDTHHETDYWMVTTKENEEAITAELVAIWEQLSERFKDYDDHLIFEGMNEPRVKGSAQEWNGGMPSERAVVDNMNQAFVETVRNSGGNNADRYLIICTYGNNCSDVTIRNLIIPDDDHIIVSVHMYTPYKFTYAQESGDITKWDGSLAGDIASQVKLLKTYLYNKGIPVIITEFGAMNKNNEADVVAWIKDYMSATNEYDFKVIWWDNGNYNSNGEKFAIFNRNDCTWYSQAIADALIENSICEQ